MKNAALPSFIVNTIREYNMYIDNELTNWIVKPFESLFPIVLSHYIISN